MNVEPGPPPHLSCPDLRRGGVFGSLIDPGRGLLLAVRGAGLVFASRKLRFLTLAVAVVTAVTLVGLAVGLWYAVPALLQAIWPQAGSWVTTGLRGLLSVALYLMLLLSHKSPTARLHDEGHGAVVDQIHVHVGGEAPGGDLDALPADLGRQVVVQGLGEGRILGAVEARAVALAGRAGERELAYDQARAGDVFDRKVHGRATREDAQGRELACQRVRVRSVIAALDPGENHKPEADLADDLTLDAHLGARNALDDDDHRAHPARCSNPMHIVRPRPDLNRRPTV